MRLNELIDQTDAPGLRFKPYEPAWPSGRLPRHKSIFEKLKKGDVLLHHPFESFEPVVQMLREAVLDPDVLAIKQTIYRTGAKSELMDLLIEAARRGKEVMCVVELKARSTRRPTSTGPSGWRPWARRWCTASSATRRTPSCC